VVTGKTAIREDTVVAGGDAAEPGAAPDRGRVAGFRDFELTSRGPGR
jgi:hypothetical protein